MLSLAERRNFRPLAAWTGQHMPDLHQRLLAAWKKDQWRVILNGETGLRFTPSDAVEPTMAAYLEALQSKKEAMPQTLNEAARAVRQHARALIAAQARKQELETELAAVSAQVAQLEQDEAGIRYSLLEAALGHADEAAQGAASKH